MPDKDKDQKDQLIEKYKKYSVDPEEYVSKDYKKDFEDAYAGKGEYFKIKDLKYNLRHGLKYPKSVIDDMVKASYKEGVDPVDALATMMRESGNNQALSNIGSYTPRAMFSSWSNPYVNTPNFKDYLMSKYPYGEKTSGGYQMKEWDYINSKDLQNIDKDYATYSKKVSDFKNKAKELEPFQAEIRWMKQLGSKYNPGEENRSGKLDKEKDIIKNNPELYDYIQNKFKDVSTTEQRKEEQKMPPLEAIASKENKVQEIPYTRTLEKVTREYDSTGQRKTPNGVVWTTPGTKYHKVYTDGSKLPISRSEYEKWIGFNHAPENIKLQAGTETVPMDTLTPEQRKKVESIRTASDE